MRLTTVTWMAAIALLAVPAAGQAADATEKGQQHFHLTMPHDPQECLAALDNMAAKDKKLLEKTDWGCRFGDHTGYVTVVAADEQAALALVPEHERANAKAQRVGKFTSQDLAAIHKKKAQAK